MKNRRNNHIYLLVVFPALHQIHQTFEYSFQLTAEVLCLTFQPFCHGSHAVTLKSSNLSTLSLGIAVLVDVLTYLHKLFGGIFPVAYGVILSVIIELFRQVLQLSDAVLFCAA